MPAQQRRSSRDKEDAKQRSPNPTGHSEARQQRGDPALLIQRASHDPDLLTPQDVLHLQRAVGNQAASRLTASPAVQVSPGPAAPTIQRLSLEHHALNDDPQPSALAKNCYTAVLTWLLRAYRDVATSQAAIDIIIKKGYAGPLMKKILQMGTKLTRPSADEAQLRVTPGRIIIFASDGNPTHAAVATGRLQITGYNQTHWFSGPANVHSHSSLEGVRWVNKDTIHNSLGHAENVYEVDPDAAASVFD